MEHSSSHFRWLLFNFLCRILLGCMALGLESPPKNVTDRLTLLDFKKYITEDPFQIMSSWNNSLHFCHWAGVRCSSSKNRVVILNLESKNLSGLLPPSMGNLTFLTGINLVGNKFHGEIPQEIGRLSRLRHLNLTSNFFHGQIPANLTHCRELTILFVEKNKLVGKIPVQLNLMSKLSVLALDFNYLSGRIPTSIGNLSSLRVISLSQNTLQGSIPHEVGRLSQLEFFQVALNELSGLVPLSLYNISSLYYFCVTKNKLQGKLPEDVGITLPNLQIFLGGANNFTGHIPVSLSNASRLEMIDFSANALTGSVPTNLGILQSVVLINFEVARLGSGKVGDLNFLTSLTNCSSLKILALYGNSFGGALPLSIANFSTNFSVLTLGGNFIYGSIPSGIGDLDNLSLLGLDVNYLSGVIPDSLGKLQKLVELTLAINRLSAQIPSSLGNLTSLIYLLMDDNKLEGSIPPSLGNCRNLLRLGLSNNNLSGPVPKEIIGLSSLSIFLDISHNSLTDPLPSEVGKLIHLTELDISHNKLSSEIPSTLGNCMSMELLYIGHNFMQGTIPESLNALKGLEEIDFSTNNLSGHIPEFLGKLAGLKKLNLSFNNLEGAVPSEGVFGNASAISVLGNNKLCGGVLELHLPACPQDDAHSSRKVLAPKAVIIPVTIVLIIFLCSFGAFSVIKNTRERTLSASSNLDWRQGISYSLLFRSTNGFSEDNLIGSGSFGSVYKGIISTDGAIVAVKVLNLQQEGAFRSFIHECNALKSIRHRNLLKVITACSGVDHQGNDFKALVFEFMSNGSLEQWLHPGGDDQHQARSLSIIQRLNIAIDVASALEYLHHQCQTPITHCDLKPSNVLLDDDMTAHVCDFGLASFLVESTNGLPNSQTLSAGLKGSIGYIPPEYGLGGQVSTFGDVYSYGILLLELFVGKRPTDEIFKDGLSIHDFVATGLPEHVLHIVDGLLLSQEEIGNKNKAATDDESIIHNDSQTSAGRGIEQCLVSVFGIGLACSDSSPSERMPMNIVVNRMHAIRDSFIRFNNGNRRSRS